MPDGTIRPVNIAFADGSAFTITGVVSVVHMSATNQNGDETRYRVKIGGREHDLFFEGAGRKSPPRWFVFAVTVHDMFAKAVGVVFDVEGIPVLSRN